MSDNINNSYELEFKYNASDVKLQDFIKLINNLGFIKRLDISSWDFYYSNGKENEFVRYRASDKAELTKKAKINENNSWQRIEFDLPLDPKRITKEIVDGYLKLEGYNPNFTIYKTCVIFYLDKVSFVYYITMDENLDMLDRFIEVEYNKDRVNEVGIEKAFETLKEYAKELEKLGLTSQNRLKRSLWDLYKNDK